jgi:hypothetical protein
MYRLIGGPQTERKDCEAAFSGLIPFTLQVPRAGLLCRVIDNAESTGRFSNFRGIRPFFDLRARHYPRVISHTWSECDRTICNFLAVLVVVRETKSLSRLDFTQTWRRVT